MLGHLLRIPVRPQNPPLLPDLCQALLLNRPELNAGEMLWESRSSLAKGVCVRLDPFLLESFPRLLASLPTYTLQIQGPGSIYASPVVLRPAITREGQWYKCIILDYNMHIHILEQ